MIIDGHAHGFVAENTDEPFWWEKPPQNRIKDLLRDMDAHGVRMAALLQAHFCPNELSQKAVKDYPGRFIAFCGWGKDKTGREAAEEVETWLREPEFKGVGEAVLRRLQVKGKGESFRGLIREWKPVMDVVSAKNVPILFHTGYSGAHSGRGATPLKLKDPIYLDDLIVDYQGTPIIIGHSGGLYPPYDQNAILLAFNYTNVYLDLSKSRTDVIERVVREIGPSKLLFGSDWVSGEETTYGPKNERTTHLYDRNIKIVEEARISDEDKEKIFYKNIQSLLKL